MIKRILPHFVLILSLAVTVLLVIDQFNSAMQFIDNGLSKGLMLALCVLAAVNAVMQIVGFFRRKTKKTK